MSTSLSVEIPHMIVMKQTVEQWFAINGTNLIFRQSYTCLIQLKIEKSCKHSERRQFYEYDLLIASWRHEVSSRLQEYLQCGSVNPTSWSSFNSFSKVLFWKITTWCAMDSNDLWSRLFTLIELFGHSPSGCHTSKLSHIDEEENIPYPRIMHEFYWMCQIINSC